MSRNIEDTVKKYDFDIGKWAKNNRVLVDTGFFNFEYDHRICGDLYDGRWDLLSHDVLSSHLNHAEFLELLISEHDVCITPEVETELGEYVIQLNNHLSYFSEPRKSVVGRKSKSKHGIKKNRKISEWRNEAIESFRTYRLLTNKMFSIFKKLSRQNPRSDFDDAQNRLYE